MRQLKISMNKEEVEKVFPELHGEVLEPNMECLLFDSGAKLIKLKRGGEWMISGYTPKGEDVIEAIAEIMERKNKKALANEACKNIFKK